MQSIDIFYQCGERREIEHIEVDPDSTFAMLKSELIERHGVEPDAALFHEDEDEPIEVNIQVVEYLTPVGVKVHLNRCHCIKVGVNFNGETIEREFGPGTTIARVKRWVTEDKFGIPTNEAGEHVLQIVGEFDRPPAGTHVGTLAHCPDCAVMFDLVTDEKVNGST